MKLTLKNIYNTISKYFIQILIISFLLFLQTYIIVKTELFATKQDIGEITDIVESIKSDNAKELEEIKASLRGKGEIQSTRRQVYTELAQSMKIFIDGGGNKERIEKFYNDYSTMWLWANDNTIKELNNFINIIKKVSVKPGSVPQEMMKSSYTKCMLAMRKEIFPNTELNDDDFEFLKFD